MKAGGVGVGGLVEYRGLNNRIGPWGIYYTVTYNQELLKEYRESVRPPVY